jgi:hypothetical protein
MSSFLITLGTDWDSLRALSGGITGGVEATTYSSQLSTGSFATEAEPVTMATVVVSSIVTRTVTSVIRMVTSVMGMATTSDETPKLLKHLL